MSKIKNWLYWTPRILAILFTVFISLFALDVFMENYTFLETLIALFMHLIPTYILIIIILIAWKWEQLGGIIFIILGLVFTLFFRTYLNLVTFLTISAPLFLIGLLFMLNKIKKVEKGVKRKSGK